MSFLPEINGQNYAIKFLKIKSPNIFHKWLEKWVSYVVSILKEFMYQMTSLCYLRIYIHIILEKI